MHYAAMNKHHAVLAMSIQQISIALVTMLYSVVLEIPGLPTQKTVHATLNRLVAQMIHTNLTHSSANVILQFNAAQTTILARIEIVMVSSTFAAQATVTLGKTIISVHVILKKNVVTSTATHIQQTSFAHAIQQNFAVTKTTKSIKTVYVTLSNTVAMVTLILLIKIACVTLPRIVVMVIISQVIKIAHVTLPNIVATVILIQLIKIACVTLPRIVAMVKFGLQINSVNAIQTYIAAQKMTNALI